MQLCLSAKRAVWFSMGLFFFLAAAPVPAGAAAWRVICGNTVSAYTDNVGYVWSTDQAYTPGTWGYVAAGSFANFTDYVENTYDNALYQHERLGCSYRFDLPPGTYFVKLLFAENWWGLAGHTGVGGRVFNVSANGVNVLNNFDILSQSGQRAKRALVKSFMVTVTGTDPTYPNQILLATSASVDQSKFSAIEISDASTLTDTQDFFAPAAPGNEEAFRLNCGGTKAADADGTLWMADEAFSQCQRWGYVNGTPRAAGYTWAYPGDYRLKTWREGGTDFKYRLALPNGTYRVNLVFAEQVYVAPGQRVFDVSVNGENVAAGLDVYALAGAGVPLTRTAVATVTDGLLEIAFPRVTAGLAMLNELEVKALAVTDADFLDFVERQGVDFFTNTSAPFQTTGAANGLVVDRSRNFVSPAQPGACSIASVGFGLAAVTAARARGWLGAAAARQQVYNTLNFFSQAVPYVNNSQNQLTHKNGFYFHFMDMATGKRDLTCELSSIDTALLFAGMLTARNALADSQVSDLADFLTGRAQWLWMNTASPDGFVAGAWAPETPGNGFTTFLWSGYNEGVLLDFLGVGSQQYPLSTSCWFNMSRAWYANSGVAAMIQSPWGPTSLFTHLYPQCFLDLRNLQDDKNDYFQNTAQAVLMDQKYCASQAAQFSTYAQGGWGISAGDSPIGGLSYCAYNILNGQNDGTVNPAMVGAAVPFAPSIAVPTLRRMFFQYKHFLWGRFGFANAYNLSAPPTLGGAPGSVGWVSPDVIGIDLGSMLLGIENYRTGWVWKNFMAAPSMQKALERLGFGNLTLDDFENDHDFGDEALARDAQWYSTNTSVYALANVAGAQGNTTACLSVAAHAPDGAPGESLVMGQLGQRANMSYFAQQHQLRFQACGPVNFQIKFRDLDGHDSAYSAAVTGTGTDAWKDYTWDYSALNWQQCDSRRVDSIFFYPRPTQAGDLAFYIDNVALGAPPVAGPTPAPSSTPAPDLLGGRQLLIYPNPAHAHVHFLFATTPGAAQVYIDIYSISGERIASLETSVADPTQPFTADWQKLRTAPGVYLCRILIKSKDGSVLARHLKKFAVL